MKNILLVFLFASILVMGTVPLSYAIDLTLDSASAVWTATIGGANVNGLGTNEVRWGTTAGQQSGFRFDVTTTPQVISTGVPFSLGDFVHLNFPVAGGSSAAGATLDIDLEISNGNTEMETFTFDFLIDETPNVSLQNCGPLQMSQVGCDDIITFLNSMASTLITIDGIEYELELLGFGPTPNNLQTMFITQENMESSAMLWAQLQQNQVIGGDILPINSASLLIAGAFTNAIFIVPILAGIAGTTAIYLKTLKS